SKIYCFYDCDVLMEGYIKFKQMVKQICSLNIDNYISISSIAHQYMLNKNVYHNVCEVKGLSREFIQKCIVGGRVMCSQNKPCHIKGDNIRIQDFDAVSLYPSAMSRIGIPCGKPETFENISYEQIKTKYHTFFCKIKILKVGIKRKFPLVNFKDDKGIRQFNDNIQNYIDKYIYVDNISLEDLINFQQVEFKIICGEGFTQKRNLKIQREIKYLFNKRLKYKKEKNPIQEVIKLLMNSVYGKTTLRPISKEKIIKNTKEDCIKYVSQNHNNIEYFEPLGFETEHYVVKRNNSIYSHQNYAHVASLILSMSKRIMNEVMCLAEDLGIEIFYQDTDSMHLFEKDIELLSTEFKKKYNRELIGTNLGQFHCDFNFQSDETPYAVESIFLTKKVYCDKVRVINNGIEEFKYHIRMKGISTNAVLNKCKELNCTPMELYLKLYNGETLEFNLVGGSMIKFKYNTDYTISTYDEFNRKI
ncbi:MAG: hypothetical protein KDH96_11985, partial [Candidatus Riesia sp.]|nr:hypothetical protein [Candidatus Riesia sp.]